MSYQSTSCMLSYNNDVIHQSELAYDVVVTNEMQALMLNRALCYKLYWDYMGYMQYS